MFDKEGRKVVRTGAYGKNAADCLARFFSRLTGKIRIPGEYMNIEDLQFDRKLLYFASHASVSTEPDNEIVLRFCDALNSIYKRVKEEILRLPDRQIVRLLADLAQEALPYLKYMLSNGVEFDGGFGSVEEYEYLIKILRKQEPDSDDDPAVVEKLRGERYDPFRTEMEIEWRREKNEASEKYIRARNEIYRKFSRQHVEFVLINGESAENAARSRKYEADFRNELARLARESEEKMNEIDSSYEKILKSAGKTGGEEEKNV